MPGRETHLVTISPLLRRVDAVEKLVAESLDRIGDPGGFNDINTDSKNAHGKKKKVIASSQNQAPIARTIMAIQITKRKIQPPSQPIDNTRANHQRNELRGTIPRGAFR